VQNAFVRTVEAVLNYARQLAAELEEDMVWEPGDVSGGWWKATEHTLGPHRIAARAAAALEFLRQYAGPESFWTLRARTVYDNNHQSPESGARALSDLLLGWARQVEAGIVDLAGSQAWAEVGIVSTDIMSQVRRLLEDRKTHPAASMVLCGAALEIALRAVAEARGLELADRPSLTTYGHLLRTAELITAQDMKDLIQCAGLRNSAAHGEFDKLSLERAGLMEQQTNLMLRRLADLQT
jgi:hypothetical protein